jgi:hypothetical protein
MERHIHIPAVVFVRPDKAATQNKTRNNNDHCYDRRNVSEPVFEGTRNRLTLK